MEKVEKFQFKNYYNSRERKFTFLHLEIRELSFSDIVILVVFITAIVSQFVLTQYFPIKRYLVITLISMATWILTTTTSFGLRFRSLYFFIIWLILCLIFIFAGTYISFIPLSTFVLYQIVRLLFWHRYSKEFIPFRVSRGKIEFSRKIFQPSFDRIVSKIEGRGGYKEDKQYMKWLVRIGLVLYILCLWLELFSNSNS